MDTEAELTQADLVELWQSLSIDPDSPERHEITERGELVMSPRPTGRHQMAMAVLAEQLLDQLGRFVLSEPAIVTRGAGVRCPDLAWLPASREIEGLVDGPMLVMPPLIVEVLSPSNNRAETAYKVHAYLASGAQEVAIAGMDGRITFHRIDGAHDESAMGVRLALPSTWFSR